MSISEMDEGPRSEPFIDWRAIAAGAVVASGISSVLLAFGSAVGLAVSSTAPTWRDSTVWTWIVSGLFLVLVSLASFAFAGYTAGRMRAASRYLAGKESEFRDGMHGLITWALAILIASVLALGAAAIGSAATSASTPSSSAASSAGETLLASELDTLFRTEGALPGNFSYRRSEAARILLTTSGHDGVSMEDRAYLTAVVARTTGDPEAGTRVDQAIAESSDAIHRARVAAVLQAFMIGAALLIGAAVAWFAATEGGEDRQQRLLPVWDWSFRRRRMVQTRPPLT